MATPAQANLSKAELLTKLSQGVEVWNGWKHTTWTDNPEPIDLSDAVLDKANLGGFDLGNVNFARAKLRSAHLDNAILSHAILREADLSRATLSHAELLSADLTEARLNGCNFAHAKLNQAILCRSRLVRANLEKSNLWGADLTKANLHSAKLREARLTRTNFREANLRDTDLTGAKGSFFSVQLAGADLASAKLPELISNLYEKLESVSLISDSAKKLFLALLAACLYSWLTIGTTKDVDLITNRASSPLPIIQTAIPIVGFYVIAPTILLCVYFYFHFYLQKLWEELAQLPAIFPDGKALHERADPWLFNDLVRAHFSRLKENRPLLSYFQQWTSTLLAWWLVPLTLLLFWSRYLSRHDLIASTVLGLLLEVSILSGLRLYRLARNTLRGSQQLTFKWESPSIVYAYALLVSLTAISLIGVGLLTATIVFQLPNLQSNSAPRRKIQTALPLRHLITLNFNDAEISLKPANWTGKNEEELDLVKGANLRGIDLRFMSAERAFLAKAQLQGSDLQGADLRNADLRQANLTGVNLQYANLGGADLGGAILSSADLTGADFDGANLAQTDLGHDPTAACEVIYASFKHTKGLTPSIKNCNHWDIAFYNEEMLTLLGLSPDHNQALEAYVNSPSEATFDSFTTRWRQEMIQRLWLLTRSWH